MSSIADMVEQMLMAGVDSAMIVLAVRTAEMAAHPPDSRVDTTIEKRRAWDRAYRAKKRESTRLPPDIPPDPENPLSLKNNINIRKKERARSTRLPPDFEPNEEMVAYSHSLGMTDLDIAEQKTSMVDWSASSLKGAKLDWLATWRTWSRKFVKEHPRAPPASARNGGGGFYAVAGSDQLAAWDDHREATEGKRYPKDKSGGWHFPSEWPPKHEAAA
jgi:hypothetical protein